MTDLLWHDPSTGAQPFDDCSGWFLDWFKFV
jgi:hypothetical protein